MQSQEIQSDGRFEQAQKLIIELASGNFTYRSFSCDVGDDVDAIIMGINMLGEELQESVQSRNYFESILKGIRQPLFILSDKLNIAYINNAVSEHLGYRLDEIKGEPFEMLLSQSSAKYIKDIRENGIQFDKPLSFQAILIGKFGQKATHILSLNQLNPNNRLNEGAILCSAQDISDLINKERKIIQLNDELNTLIYQISHELRSPVANILGLTSLSREAMKSGNTIGIAQVSTLLDLIEKSGIKLDDLLKSFMTIVEAQHYAFDKSINALSEITTLVNALKVIHSRLDFNVVIDIPNDLKLEIDKNLFNQVMMALLKNAVEYKKPDPESALNIVIHYAKSNSYHNLTISDNGIGIDPENISKITQMFFKGSNDSSGSGFGLYMTQKVMNSINGKIKIDSELGQYTAITLSFPNKNS